ncbi:MAG: hypothetical protein MUE60_13370 [Candidatus Eisenbacteria bacterium]|jgi:hypothetical protein|nr:hypothetical protein [Candidatus Eisenbacteria bacterium]
MSEERIRILRLVAEGKATPEEAERLLSAVGKEAPLPVAKGTPRYLRVTVDSSDGDKVNIRVPLALVRAGMKFSALVPRDAREQMEEKGIDLTALSSMDTEELIQALKELEVNVDSHDGDVVRVFCE